LYLVVVWSGHKDEPRNSFTNELNEAAVCLLFGWVSLQLLVGSATSASESKPQRLEIGGVQEIWLACISDLSSFFKEKKNSCMPPHLLCHFSKRLLLLE
jgi:hypothetical protein